MNNLVQFWKDWKPSQHSKPPFVHHEDLPSLQREFADQSNRANFDRYIDGPRFSPNDNFLHLSLFPVPYAGNLKSATVVILLLNPGFNYGDYWAEYKNREFRDRLKRNLNQDFDGIDFPFMFLDPKFCWSSGFQWWEQKLRDVARRIMERTSKSYSKALCFLSRRLACVELFPYHSFSLRSPKRFMQLPSVEAAKTFAQNLAANSRGKTLIVTRGKAEWGIKPRKGVCVYSAGEARGASLGENSRAWPAIMTQLGLR
jgi:hypothetical protein